MKNKKKRPASARSTSARNQLPTKSKATGLRFAVAVDCEGVACAVGSPNVSLNESRNLGFAQLQATREADAAVRALFDSGAEQVIVWDNHSTSLNLHYDLLDERCEVALGVGFRKRFEWMEENFDGLLFIGYHAMDNTVDAVMCHTFSSPVFQYMKINGIEVGELAIDAAMAGEKGVPVLFVSSDDKGIQEAKSLFPHAETVTTKRSLGWNCAVSKHPKRTITEIYNGVLKAVANRQNAIPFTYGSPLELEIRFKRMENAESASRGYRRAQRLDAYTVRFRLNGLSDYF